MGVFGPGMMVCLPSQGKSDTWFNLIGKPSKKYTQVLVGTIWELFNCVHDSPNCVDYSLAAAPDTCAKLQRG